jgi:hypothetical protein
MSAVSTMPAPGPDRPALLRLTSEPWPSRCAPCPRCQHRARPM